ncbi:MAG: PAQR family membrane homeostasis protein TrhA [Candidatus Izemoplasmataceae bacterium]
MDRKDILELIANAISHGIGLLLSISAMIVLIATTDTTVNSIATFVFGICLIILYTASTLFHSFPPSMKRVIAVFQRLDHSAIYLLIVGTYTPFIVILVPTQAGYTLLIILWLIAITGIVFKSIWVKKHHYLHLALYLLMGWSILTIWPWVYSAIPSGALVFLILGGLSYTFGVFFYIKKFRFAHFIWHLFVLAGSLLHFISIYQLI